MIMQYWWSNTNGGKPKYLEKNLYQYHNYYYYYLAGFTMFPHLPAPIDNYNIFFLQLTSTTMSITNPIWTGLALNPGITDQKLVTA
jgi:hypothetical protein